MRKKLRYYFKKVVYFEGRLITEFRYHNILTKGYRDMLKKTVDGETYPTWA